MSDRTALQVWIAIGILASACLALAPMAWVARAFAGCITLAGVVRILMLSRLMYRARKVRMAGLWIVFSMITAAISALWMMEPLVR